MEEKLLLLILLLYTAIGMQSQNSNINPQNDCGFGLVLMSGDKDSIQTNINLRGDREVSLFEDYDFKNEAYQLIYIRTQNDTSLFYYISDKEGLLKLQMEYLLNQPIFDTTKNCSSDRGGIAVLLENEIIGSFDVKWECSQIDTKCGLFNFDPTGILNAGQQCNYNDNAATFYSKSSLDSFIAQIEKDTNVICFGLELTDYVGHFQFEYIDSSNLIQSILRDSFYLNIILQEAKLRSEPSAMSDSMGLNMGLIRMIMQSIIDKKFIWNEYIVEDIRQLPSEIPIYLVTIKSNDKGSIPDSSKLGTLVFRKEKPTYKIWSISKEITSAK